MLRHILDTLWSIRVANWNFLSIFLFVPCAIVKHIKLALKKSKSSPNLIDLVRLDRYGEIGLMTTPKMVIDLWL